MAENDNKFINLRSTGTSGALTHYPDGKFLSVWTDFDKSGGAYVYGKVFNADGSAVGNHFLIDYVSGASYRDITTTTLTDGRTVVAWVKSDGTQTVVGKVLGKNFEVPSARIELGNPVMTGHEAPQVFATQDGGFSVLYSGVGPFGPDSIRAVRLNEVHPQDNGTWSHTYSDIHTRVDDPTVATIIIADRSLVAAVANTTANDTTLTISVFDTEGGVTEVETITIEGIASGINPAISSLGDGGFIVAWEDVDNNGGFIRAKAFYSNGQTAAFRFEKPNELIDGTPVIKQLDGGGFAIAFVVKIPSGQGLYVQDLYTAAVNANGDAVVESTRVGTVTAGDQWDPSITTLSNGTYAVSWQSNGESGSPQYIVEVIGREGTDVTTVITPGGTGEPPPPPPPPPPPTSNTWTGTEGNDVLIGNAASELFYGRGGHDKISGGNGNDGIDGGSGNDRIRGGLGNDILKGGEGFNEFVFDTKPHKSTNKDEILDFHWVFDEIWLDNKVFTKLGKKGSESKPALLKKSYFASEKAKDKDDYIIYSKKKGVISYDADGSGSKYKAVEFATVKPGTKIIWESFYVI